MEQWNGAKLLYSDRNHLVVCKNKLSDYKCNRIHYLPLRNYYQAIHRREWVTLSESSNFYLRFYKQVYSPPPTHFPTWLTLKDFPTTIC